MDLVGLAVPAGLVVQEARVCLVVPAGLVALAVRAARPTGTVPTVDRIRPPEVPIPRT